MNTDASHRIRPILTTAAALVVLAWSVGLDARAQDLPIFDYVDQKMIDIGAQLQNAKMRLSKDFAGVDPYAGGQPPTLVISCCRANLEKIDGKLKELRWGMSRMDAFYRERHNSTAGSILVQMNARVDQLRTGLIAFARANEKQRALDARTALVRPWNEFRNGLRALRNCCPIPIEVAPDAYEQSLTPTGGQQGDADPKKDKKQRKKDKKENKEQDGQES